MKVIFVGKLNWLSRYADSIINHIRYAIFHFQWSIATTTFLIRTLKVMNLLKEHHCHIQEKVQIVSALDYIITGSNFRIVQIWHRHSVFDKRCPTAKERARLSLELDTHECPDIARHVPSIMCRDKQLWWRTN